LCARVCVWRFAAKIQNDLRILTERLARINDNLARKVSSRTEYDKTITETEAAYSKIMESSQTLLHVLKRESVNLTKKKQGSSWACGVASAQALRGRSACSSLGAPSRVHGDKTALALAAPRPRAWATPSPGDGSWQEPQRDFSELSSPDPTPARRC
jgi:hypothetical protein